MRRLENVKLPRATDEDIKAARSLVAAMAKADGAEVVDVASFHIAMMRIYHSCPYGGLERVVEGMAEMLDPDNEIVDQDQSHLELHPSIRSAQAFAAAASQVDADLARFGMELGQPTAAACFLVIAAAAHQTEKREFTGRINDAVFNGENIGNWEVEIRGFTPHSVTGYSRKSLVERAVRNARNRRPLDRQLWAVIMDTFGLGSNYSAELCRMFGLDPDQKMPGVHCEACAEREGEETSA